MREKCKFKSVLICLATAIPVALPAKVTMTVSGPSPGDTEFRITDKTVLFFDGSTLDVTEDGKSEGKFTIADGDKLVFTTGGSGVDNVATDTETFRLLRNPVRERLEFTGSALPSDFKIHSLDGAAVLSGKDWNGEAIDVSSLAQGAYLFTTEGKTIKFIKS